MSASVPNRCIKRRACQTCILPSGYLISTVNIFTMKEEHIGEVDAYPYARQMASLAY